MFFGKPEVFAIETTLLEDTGSCHLGLFRFWIENTPIGSFHDTISLDYAKRGLEEFLARSEQRFEAPFDALSKEEVFELVFDSIIVTIPKNKTVTEVMAHREKRFRDFSYLEKMEFRDRFHLDDIGQESFMDKVNIVLIRRADFSERLIWRDLQSMVITEKILSPDVFDETATKFINWRF